MIKTASFQTFLMSFGVLLRTGIALMPCDVPKNSWQLFAGRLGSVALHAMPFLSLFCPETSCIAQIAAVNVSIRNLWKQGLGVTRTSPNRLWRRQIIFNVWLCEKQSRDEETRPESGFGASTARQDRRLQSPNTRALPMLNGTRRGRNEPRRVEKAP